MKYNKKLLNDFNYMIKKSLNPVEGYDYREITNDRYYYERRYADSIIDYFKLTGRKSNEFNKTRGHDDLCICSMASSGRLCFLFLCDKTGIKFEWHELNGTSDSDVWLKPSRNDAQYDAFDGKTFYECKCQEIFNEHEGLSESYIPVLKNFFEIKVGSIDGEISAKVSDFHIKGDIADKDYRELHFDLKQLFTHLCAIVKAKGNVDKYNLNYIFFKPKQEEIDKNDIIKNAYEQLEKELKAIKESKLFTEYCHIKFDYQFVSVDDNKFAIDPQNILKSKKKEILKKYETRLK